jgi:hypothetical protein
MHMHAHMYMHTEIGLFWACWCHRDMSCMPHSHAGFGLLRGCVSFD